MTLLIFCFALIGLLSLAWNHATVFLALRRDRMSIRAIRARLARAQALYEQGMAATTDAERGRIIEELLKDCKE